MSVGEDPILAQLTTERHLFPGYHMVSPVVRIDPLSRNHGSLKCNRHQDACIYKTVEMPQGSHHQKASEELSCQPR